MRYNNLRKTTCMSQQLGNEVEKQGKANKSTTPRTALSCALVGGIRTNDTLQSRRAVYQLSYQGNSAVTVCTHVVVDYCENNTKGG